MNTRGILIWIALLPATAFGQGLDPAALLKLPTDTWPTYNGDYSGRRHSPLAQVNASNIGSLTLAWVYRANSVPIKSTPLEVNGILYFTVPDHVWAVDARTGREIWHYKYTSNGGDHMSKPLALPNANAFCASNAPIPRPCRIKGTVPKFSDIQSAILTMSSPQISKSISINLPVLSPVPR